MKIVINRCFGGFGLSGEGLTRYTELSGVPDFDPWQISRDDKFLVRTVEELGERAAGPFSALEVVEIPDDVNWEIGEHDGAEKIHECHRSWP